MGIIKDGLLNSIRNLELNYQAKNFREFDKVLKKVRSILYKKVIMSIKVNIKIEYMDSAEDYETLESLL